MKPIVYLYYDVVSPYSWIAFETSCRYAKRWPIDLRLVPAFLSGIMKESGNEPPGNLDVRGRYMIKDISRVAKHYAIPVKLNSNTFEAMFVKGSLRAQRLLTRLAYIVGVTSPTGVVYSPPGSQVELVSRRLWQRIWSSGEDITTDQSLRDVLASVHGLSEAAGTVDDLLNSISSTQVKELLHCNTQSALRLGAFGLPVFHLEKNNLSEMVFGSDRWHIIADILGQPYLGPLTELSAFRD